MPKYYIHTHIHNTPAHTFYRFKSYSELQNVKQVIKYTTYRYTQFEISVTTDFGIWEKQSNAQLDSG
jgi:hypothetical protein